MACSICRSPLHDRRRCPLRFSAGQLTKRAGVLVLVLFGILALAWIVIDPKPAPVSVMSEVHSSCPNCSLFS